MKYRDNNITQDMPHLYYKTREDIEAYKKKPVKLKLQWLEEQMKFFHKAMPKKAKKIREKLNLGKLSASEKKK